MIQEYKSNLKLLKKISKESGLKEFWLLGSITYEKPAKLIGIKFKPNDYDLAIEGGREEYLNIEKLLKGRGFQILKSRPYYIKFKKSFQIIAKNKLLYLDIAIVKNLKDLGHFNWESIFWDYPSGEVYDPYNSIEAIKKGILIPVVSINEENPFILGSRFLKLCARFNLDFHKDKRLKFFAKNLASLIESWKKNSYFHNKYARGHAYFGVIQAILRTKEKDLFIKKLHQSGLLNAIFPEIDKMLKYSKKINGIKSAKNSKEVIKYFREFLEYNPKELKSLNKKISLMSYRIN